VLGKQGELPRGEHGSPGSHTRTLIPSQRAVESRIGGGRDLDRLATRREARDVVARNSRHAPPDPMFM
jgi:hypothetical protein